MSTMMSLRPPLGPNLRCPRRHLTWIYFWSRTNIYLRDAQKTKNKHTSQCHTIRAKLTYIIRAGINRALIFLKQMNH